MARKPSNSSHRQKPPDELNLTPLIDMITCLMFFLLIFAGMIPVVIIDAPLPKIASTAEEVRKAKKTDNDFDLTVYIRSNGFTVDASGMGKRAIPKKGGEYDYDGLRRRFLDVHKRKPKHRELTMVPSDEITYDVMIRTMDVARSLREGDPGFQPVPGSIASKPESQQFNQMFPNVSIGGV